MLGNNSDNLEFAAILEVPDYEELEQLDEICPLQEKLDCIHLSEEMQEKLIQYQKEEKLAQVPRYLLNRVVCRHLLRKLTM